MVKQAEKNLVNQNEIIESIFFIKESRTLKLNVLIVQVFQKWLQLPLDPNLSESSFSSFKRISLTLMSLLEEHDD